MAIESTVKRIGGSTFALLPPDYVRSLGLKDEEKVLVEVRKLAGTGKDLEKLRGRYPDLPDFDRQDMWGE